MPFDASAYLRLEAPQCISSSAAGLTLATSTGDILEASTFGPGIFRLRVGPHTRPDYGLVVGRSQSCTTNATGTTFRIASGDAVLELDGTPLRFRLRLGNGALTGSTTDEDPRAITRLPAFGRVRQGGQWVAALALASGEAIYGLGEKFGGLDRRGQLHHSWVQDAGGVNTGLAYKETPFAWSPGTGRGAWGVFVHTPGAVIHGVGHPDWSHRSYALVVDDEALDLFLFAARDPAALLAQFASLTGAVPPVPRWSLGTWVAHTGLRSVEEAGGAVAQLRERRIPCDVLALEGRSVWDPDLRTDFEWRGVRARALSVALTAIRNARLHVALWSSPYVSVASPSFEGLAASGDLLQSAYGGPYVMSGRVAPGWSVFDGSPAPDFGFTDFTLTASTEWFKDAHATWFAHGIDAIHADCAEHVPDDALAANGELGVRLHNVYPLLYHRAVREAAEKHGNPAEGPPLVVGRAAWAGSPRVMLGCAGDAQNDWEALAATIRGALSWGMSGGPLQLAWAPGNYGSEAPGAELALRWLQFALFSSHFGVRGPREHAPWALGAESEAVARKWLAFRYRLLPYVEATVRHASATGLPVMRAMPLAFPGNALLASYETQFLCGDALLVAPIVQAGGEVEIAFPPGAWFDLNSRQRIVGPRIVRYRATLERYPVFGREGFALPLGPAVQHTGEVDPDAAVEQLWLFGTTQQPLAGIPDVTFTRDPAGNYAVHANPRIKIERFGAAPG